MCGTFGCTTKRSGLEGHRQRRQYPVFIAATASSTCAASTEQPTQRSTVAWRLARLYATTPASTVSTGPSFASSAAAIAGTTTSHSDSRIATAGPS